MSEFVKELLNLAVDLPAEQRGHFLERICGDDVGLLREVTSLLRFMDAGPIPSHPFEEREHPIEEGTLLADRYRILQRLGEGASSSVYRARDQLLGVPVVVKVLRSTSLASRAQMIREVRLARSISHRCVRRTFDFSAHDGTPFVTMEYVDGTNLREQLTRFGPIAPSRALELARDLCGGLAAAHDAGILHRDINPENILVDRNGRALLSDFGLAVPEGQTVGMLPAGSPRYLAPELMSAVSSQPASVQSDLYALALVLHEILTGAHPFEAAAERGTVFDRPRSKLRPRALAAERLERAIEWALAVDPAARPRSAHEMRAVLHEAAAPRIASTGLEILDSIQRSRLACVALQVVDRGPLLGSGLADVREEFERARAWQALAAKSLLSHGARVVSLERDRMLVCFDAETSFRMAEAAVDGALAALDCLEASGYTAVRAGVATGPTIVEQSRVGPDRLTFESGLGPTAARALAECADAGSVWASRDVLAILGGSLEEVDHSLSGECKSGQRIGHGWRTAASTDFFGRSAELGLLKSAWHSVQRGGTREVVVSGEGGIGKSRLIAELLRGLEGEPASWLVLRGHEGARETPFAPWRSALTQAIAELRSGDHPDAAIDLDARAAARAWARSVEDETTSHMERRRCVERVLMNGLRDRLARGASLVLVTEDLQWFDSASLDLLEAICTETTVARLLIVGTCRPSFLNRRPSRPGAMQISLGPLEAGDVMQLVRAIAGCSAPSTLVEKLADRSHGIPLFAKELARAFVQGLVRPESIDLAIPNSLSELLTYQISRMEWARDVLQAAAVLGDRLSQPLLQAIADAPKQAVAEAVEVLIEAGYLRRSLSDGRASLRFAHSLFADAMYELLKPDERIAISRRCAQAIVAIEPEYAARTPSAVALQWERGQVPGEAASWWKRSSDRAMEVCAYEEAERSLRRGISMLTNTTDAERMRQRLDLHLSLAGVLSASAGHWATATLEQYEEAARLQEQAGNPHTELRCAVGLARASFGRNDRAAAGAALRRLDAVGQQVEDPPEALHAWQASASICLLMGDHARADALYRRVLSVGPFDRRLVGPEFFVDTPSLAHLFLAWNEWYLGRFRSSRDQLRLCWERANAVGHRFTTGYSFCIGSHVALCWGDLDVAEEAATSGLRSMIDIGATGYARLAETTLSVISMQRGPADAAAPSPEAFAPAASRQAILGTVMLGYLGRILQRAGCALDALAVVDEGLELSATRLERVWEPELLRIRGTLLQADDAVAAETAYAKARSLARERGARALDLRAATSLARWRIETGRPLEARDLLRPVADSFLDESETADLREARALLLEI